MKRFAFSLFITLVILLILLTQISFQDLFDLLIKLDLFWGILGSISYLLALFLRALRFRWLIHSTPIPLSELFKITVFYHLSLMVLPSKLGEFSYPYFLNRRGWVAMTEGLASLIASRVFDFFIVLIIFLFAVIGFQASLEVDLILTALLSTLLTLFVLLVFFYMNNCLRLGSLLIGKVAERIGLENNKGIHWIQRKINEMAEDFYAIKGRKTYLVVSLASFVSWVAIFFVFYTFMRGFGIELSFPKVVFGSIIAVIANALPISGLGNWGTLEAGWAAGFLIVGLPKEEAIATGFGVHILIFLLCGLIAFFCWASLDLKGRKEKGKPSSKFLKKNVEGFLKTTSEESVKSSD